jgi:hypothetical protein
MADSAGALTEAQRKEIAEKLDKIWTGSAKNCPICGSNQWLVGQHLVQPITLKDNALQLGGTGYPQIMLISRPCGYTLFFNAVIFGVVPPESESEAEGNEPDG